MPIRHLTPLLAVVLGTAVTLVLVTSVGRDRQRLGALPALLSLLGAAGASAWLSSTTTPQLTFSETWALDDVTAWGIGIVALLTALVVASSPRWFQTDRRHGEWYVMLLFSSLGSMVLVGAADAMELVVGMLLASVSGYTLASYHRRHRMSAEAGAKLFLLGALANPLLLLGVVFLYGATGATTYAAVASAIPAADPVLVGAAAALVFVGLAFELGAVPVHPWVPDVAQGSPAPAAAFLTVVPKIGALIALARLVTLLSETSLPWRPVMAGLALLTMTIGNLAALWQDDLRRMLGWSSVSQMGYGMLAVVAMGRAPLALPSLLLFAIGYGLAQLAAFAAVIALRGRTARDDYHGLARSHPWHAAVLTVAMLSFIGVPPLVGFATKVALFGAAIQAGYEWLAVAAIINTAVSVFYYLRFIAPMVLKSERDGRARPALLGGLTSPLAFGLGIFILVVGLAANVVLERTADLRLVLRTDREVAAEETDRLSEEGHVAARGDHRTPSTMENTPDPSKAIR